MRVALVSWAWPSHYYPLVPMGWALRAAGHDVRVCSSPALMAEVVGSGLPGVPVGRDLDHAGLMRAPMQDVPSPRKSREWWDALSAEAPTAATAAFLALADAMLDDLVDYFRQWRPDLVIHDTATYAAPLAAAAVGTASARHTWGPDFMSLYPGIEGALAPLLQRHGLRIEDTLPVTTFDPCPPSLQVEGPLHRTFTRFLPYNGPAVDPGWLHDVPPRPRVAVTCGTTSSTLTGGRGSLATRVVAALEGLDVDVVLALTAAELAALPPLPTWVRPVELLALHLLLPTCDVLVHRGGGVSILTAVDAEVPQLVVPELPDHAFNARRLARTGAGTVVYPDEADAAALARAVAGLVEDPQPRAATRRLSAEMASQASLAQTVDALPCLLS